MASPDPRGRATLRVRGRAQRAITGANARRRGRRSSRCPSGLVAAEVLGDLVVGAEGEERRGQGVRRREVLDVGRQSAAACVVGDVDDLDEHVDARRPIAGGRADDGDLGVEHRRLEPHGVAVAVGSVRPRPVKPTMSAWRPAWSSRSVPLPPTRIGSRRRRAGRSSGVRSKCRRGGRPSRRRAGRARPRRTRRGGPCARRRQERHAGGGELGRRVPGAEAELDATAAQAVERGDLAGEHQRVVQAGVEHERADADALGRRAAAARRCSGLQSLPTWSATSTTSKPSSSARRASAAIVRRVVGTELQPEPHRAFR